MISVYVLNKYITEEKNLLVIENADLENKLKEKEEFTRNGSKDVNSN